MSDLTIEQFITARLDEDEAIAKVIPHGEWRNVIELGADLVLDSDNDMVTVTDDLRVNPHIARYDPARVLREIAAKRKALDRYLYDDDVVMWPVVCAIASVWSDHPDYQQEWAS